MKRSPELRHLSDDHHHGLVQSHRLRLAGEGRAPLDETIDRFLAAWRAEIQPHFRLEEEVLLPELSRVVPPEDPLITRALADHILLRRAVRDLLVASGDTRRKLAREVGERLELHIRYEERILFPAVEERLPADALSALGQELTPPPAIH